MLGHHGERFDQLSLPDTSGKERHTGGTPRRAIELIVGSRGNED